MCPCAGSARGSRALPKLTRKQATIGQHAGKANKLKLYSSYTSHIYDGQSDPSFAGGPNR